MIHFVERLKGEKGYKGDVGNAGTPGGPVKMFCLYVLEESRFRFFFIESSLFIKGGTRRKRQQWRSWDFWFNGEDFKFKLIWLNDLLISMIKDKKFKR